MSLQAQTSSPKLPLELIKHVIDLMPSRGPSIRGWSPSSTLLSCALTCRALRDSCLSRLYASIDVRRNARLRALYQCADQFPSVASRLRTTETFTVYGRQQLWTDLVPQALARLCPRIIALELHAVDFASFFRYSHMFLPAFASLRCLRHLTLDGRFYDSSHAQRIICAFPILDSLTINLSKKNYIGGLYGDSYTHPSLPLVDVTILHTAGQGSVDWLLGGGRVNSLKLEQTDAEMVERCLAVVASTLTILTVALSDTSEGDQGTFSLNGCEQLRYLAIDGAREPHVVLATLSVRSEVRTLELGVGSHFESTWGQLDEALRAPQLAQLEHVHFRILSRESQGEIGFEAAIKGDGETTFDGLRYNLKNRGVSVTCFV